MMRRFLSRRWRCFWLALPILVAFLQGAPATYASSPVITQSPYPTLLVAGVWRSSNAALAEAIPAAPGYDHILINDQSYLRPDWIVTVDSEKMHILGLIDGAPGQSDTMVVARGWGTAVTSHTSTTLIMAGTVTVDIMAQNISDYYGFGAFKVDLAFPPGVEMIKLSYDYTWLGSTGRIPDCYGPTYEPPNTYEVMCASLNNPGYGQPSWYPPGPSGSGRIARVTLLPPPSGVSTVSLAGSYLRNVASTDLAATLIDVKVNVVDCPDANLDSVVNVGDLLFAAKNMNDAGVPTGATIINSVTKTQTQIAVSNQSLLNVNDTIAIGAEQMTVQQLLDASPDLMTVARGANSSETASHNGGSPIYRATTDGNYDGKKGYTYSRDVNHDGIINVGDILTIGKLFGTRCPSAP